MSTAKRIRYKKITPVKRILLTILICISCIIAITLITLAVYTAQIAANLEEVSESKVFNLSQNSRIYASDGKTVLAELQIENREPVQSLNDISPDVAKATIAIEDARFYYHHGIDFLGLFRAFTIVLTGGQTQGGSTITMQLTRNTLLSSDAQKITLERKISEMILATKIEQMYSKDQILLMYLNTINYGDRCYGIKAASKHYFSVDPKNLTLSQAATLAGIPQSPSYLAPTNNIDACTKRRNLVLGRMFDDHVIDEQAYKNALNTPIELNVSYNDPAAGYMYPYFTNYVREQILEKYSNSEIFEGGFQIYTTLDIKHQEACETGCMKANQRLEKGAEAVAVTMDPSNGYVTGIVGGDDYSVHQYNIATTKGRPTGSSFKVFTLATAISQGYDPSSYTLDCSGPMSVGNITINNVGNTNFGTRTIQGATAVSSNTGYVRLQQKVGGDNVIETARKMGIKNADLPNVTTLTLGMADITPLEMASAYATLANGGKYHEPVSITKIETASGDTIFEYDPSQNTDNGKQVIDPKIAGACTKVLQTVFTQGTATAARPANGQPVAGKTGTSDDWRDHTLIGYTPNIVISTWIGKRDYTPTSSGVDCCYLFKTIIDEITRYEDIVEFPKVDDPVYTKKSEYKEKTKDDTKDISNAPNVVGRTLSEAKSLLSQYDLLIYYNYSDTVPNGVVISQSIENGRIALHVSKGPKT